MVAFVSAKSIRECYRHTHVFERRGLICFYQVVCVNSRYFQACLFLVVEMDVIVVKLPYFVLMKS